MGSYGLLLRQPTRQDVGTNRCLMNWCSVSIPLTSFRQWAVNLTGFPICKHWSLCEKHGARHPYMDKLGLHIRESKIEWVP